LISPAEESRSGFETLPSKLGRFQGAKRRQVIATSVRAWSTTNNPLSRNAAPQGEMDRRQLPPCRAFDAPGLANPPPHPHGWGYFLTAHPRLFYAPKKAQRFLVNTEKSGGNVKKAWETPGNAWETRKKTMEMVREIREMREKAEEMTLKAMEMRQKVRETTRKARETPKISRK
jgi:hypothetical protein